MNEFKLTNCIYTIYLSIYLINWPSFKSVKYFLVFMRGFLQCKSMEYFPVCFIIILSQIILKVRLHIFSIILMQDELNAILWYFMIGLCSHPKPQTPQIRNISSWMLNEWMYTISIHCYPDVLVWRRAVKLIHQSIKEGSIPWYFSMSVKKTSTPRGRPLSLSPHEGRSPWLLKVPVCQKLLLTFQFGLYFSVRPPTTSHPPPHPQRKEGNLHLNKPDKTWKDICVCGTLGHPFVCCNLWLSVSGISMPKHHYAMLNVLCYSFSSIGHKTVYFPHLFVCGKAAKAIKPHFWSSQHDKSLSKGSD